MIDDSDQEGQSADILRRAAVVEVDAGPYGKFLMFAPSFDDSEVQLGVPMPVTITVTAIAEGAEAACVLALGWREQMRAKVAAALQPEAARH